jgi:CubicO group peptidase (beta-lactamase class C family)
LQITCDLLFRFSGSAMSFAYAQPGEIGIDPVRLQFLYDTLNSWTERDAIPAAGICIGRRGQALEPRLFGRKSADPKSPPVADDALFLTASISKPVTVTALMILVERGLLTLGDRVAQYVPRFALNGKEDVQIRHLMTHTSGLPDMLPNNDQLRAAHRPLSAFIDETCLVPLQFPPGTRVSYQSMGTAMLGEVLKRITGSTLLEFLEREIFLPLGMKDTSLGSRPQTRERIAGIRVSPEQAANDWNWNSAYWHSFGAPWGGMISTPGDFARFCLMFLGGGAFDGVRILSPATVRAMTCNQLAAMPYVPEEDRRARPWGLGWRPSWPGHSAHYGDLWGPRSFGQWGATGALVCADPDTDAFLVLFTTQPIEAESRLLSRVANMVAASFLP